jgi:hypothetical protein
LKDAIKNGVSVSIEANRYQQINNKFSEIYSIREKTKDDISNTDKQKLVKIYRELFALIEKTEKPELQNQLLLSLSNDFPSQEILILFKDDKIS